MQSRAASTVESSCAMCGASTIPQRRPLPCGPPLVAGEVRACTRCGSCQVDLADPSAPLTDLYDETYYRALVEGPGMAGGDLEPTPWLKNRLQWIETSRGRGRLLDLGCGFGVFVAHARGRGWDAVGIEPSHWAAAEGRRRYGIEIQISRLEDAELEPASFDVIHSNHVLEHLPDPVSTLKAAWRALRPGGMLVAEVPNDRVVPLADRLFARLHPAHYPKPSGTYHLFFFSPRGLRLVAERAGFEVRSVKALRHLEGLESRLPLGLPLKRLLFAIEAASGTAPAIVLIAQRPSEP